MSFLKIIHIHRYIRYIVSRYFTSLKQGILKMKTRTWRARCLEDYSLGNIHLNSRKVNKNAKCASAQPGTLNRTKTITWGFSSLAMVTFFFVSVVFYAFYLKYLVRYCVTYVPSRACHFINLSNYFISQTKCQLCIPKRKVCTYVKVRPNPEHKPGTV